MDASVRGKGIDKEMIKLAVCKAFTDPEVLAVQLNVFPENARAKRCYEGVDLPKGIILLTHSSIKTSLGADVI